MATPSFWCWAFLFSSLFSGSLGSSFIVGGSFGWTIPSESSLNYDQWAASHTFRVGDSLVFNYASELHSVLQVTRSSYKQCNVSSPFVTNSDGKTVIDLSHKGSFYFICGVPGHCQAGQRFQLKVVDAAGNVQNSQAAAAGADDDVSPAPAPAPVNGAISPATGSASSTPYLRLAVTALISLGAYSFAISPRVYTFA